MPKRPTSEIRKACKKKKNALNQTRELMEILRDVLVEYLDSPDYEDEVCADCEEIDCSLFDNGKEAELADALNETWVGSTGSCRQSLIGILEYRTEGAILHFDMKRTLDLIDKRREEYDKCVHKQA